MLDSDGECERERVRAGVVRRELKPSGFAPH